MFEAPLASQHPHPAQVSLSLLFIFLECMIKLADNMKK
jgi:hypothetical protein